MTSSAAIDYALDHPEALPEPVRPASPVQLLGLGMAESVEACALTLARKSRLLDASGQLHCWHCHKAMPWHVSLICSERCRWEALRAGEERARREREARSQRVRVEAERSRPQQRSRRFGDDE
jgi:predicted nucleic acid-binding Zn ribbon protein